MTYESIKQRVIDILGMPITEITRLEYATKIPRIFNEATFRIAHSILPNLREYTITLTADKLPARVTMPPDFISFADEQSAWLNGMPFILTQFIGSNGIILTGAEIAGYKFEDALTYKIFYNAVYPKVSDTEKTFDKVTLTTDIVNADNYHVEAIPAQDIEIPDIIGMAIPHYIAGQLLAVDDKVRSTEELNEFEILISTTSTYRHERTKEYHSVKGWY
jgi:hypothetical protein